MQDLLLHLRQREDPLQNSVLGADSRHTVHCAAGFILSNGDASGIVDRGHAFESVIAHASKNNSAGISPEDFRDGEHHYISRRPVQSAQGKIGKANLGLQFADSAMLRDGEVSSRRCNINLPRFDEVSMFGLAYLNG